MTIDSNNSINQINQIQVQQQSNNNNNNNVTSSDLVETQQQSIASSSNQINNVNNNIYQNSSTAQHHHHQQQQQQQLLNQQRQQKHPNHPVTPKLPGVELGYFPRMQKKNNDQDMKKINNFGVNHIHQPQFHQPNNIMAGRPPPHHVGSMNPPAHNDNPYMPTVGGPTPLNNQQVKLEQHQMSQQAAMLQQQTKNHNNNNNNYYNNVNNTNMSNRVVEPGNIRPAEGNNDTNNVNYNDESRSDTTIPSNNNNNNQVQNNNAPKPVAPPSMNNQTNFGGNDGEANQPQPNNIMQPGGQLDKMKTLSAAMRQLQQRDLLEAGAVLSLIEILSRWGCEQTVETLRKETGCLDESTNSQTEEPSVSAILDAIKDSNKADTVTQRETAEAHMSTLQEYMQWAVLFPLKGRYRDVYREFGLVVFVEIWMRIYCTGGADAAKSLFTETTLGRRSHEIWPHFKLLLTRLNEVLDAVPSENQLVLRNVFDGWRFQITFDDSELQYLLAHIRAREKPLLVEAFASRLLPLIVSNSQGHCPLAKFSRTVVNTNESRGLAESIIRSQAKLAPTINDRASQLRDVIALGRNIPAESTSLAWGLPEEVIDPSAVVGDLVAVALPDPPAKSKKSANDAVDLVECLLRDRVVPDSQKAAAHYGLKPRFDGELTQSSTIETPYTQYLLATHPILNRRQAEIMSSYAAIYPYGNADAARIQRRIKLRSLATRFPVDGVNRFPSVLNWEFGTHPNMQPTAWAPNLIKWEPYTGNCALAAVLFKPGILCEGYEGNSVVRIYDPQSAAVAQASNSLGKELLTVLDGEQDKDKRELKSIYPKNHLSGMILNPLKNLGIYESNTIITDSVLLNYIKHGFLLHNKGDESTGSMVESENNIATDEFQLSAHLTASGDALPSNIQAMIQESVRHAFAHLTGFQLNSRGVASETVSRDAIYEALGVLPSRNSRDMLVPTYRDTPEAVMPWQAHIPFSGRSLVTAMSWLLYGSDAENLLNQTLLTGTADGAIDMWRLPSTWEYQSVEATMRLGENSAGRLNGGDSVHSGSLGNINSIEEVDDFEDALVIDKQEGNTPNPMETKKKRGRLCYTSTNGSSKMTKELRFGMGNGVGSGVLSLDSAQPYGLYVVSSHFDCSVKVWNTSNLKYPIRLFTDHFFPASTTRFHPNAILLASGDESGDINLWDMRIKRGVAKIKGFSSAVGSLEFSPNGGLLCASPLEYYSPNNLENSDPIKIWDIRKLTRECVRTIKPSGFDRKGYGSTCTDQDSFKLRAPGVISAMAWAKGSQLLSIGYSDGSIVHGSTSQEANRLPIHNRPLDEYISPNPSIYRIQQLPLGIAPIGMQYSASNVLNIATTRPASIEA